MRRRLAVLAVLAMAGATAGCTGALADGPPDGFTKYACRALGSLYVAATMKSGDTMALAGQWALLWIDQAPAWAPGEKYRAEVVDAVGLLNDAPYADDPPLAAADALTGPERARSALGLDCGPLASPSPS